MTGIRGRLSEINIVENIDDGQNNLSPSSSSVSSHLSSLSLSRHYCIIKFARPFFFAPLSLSPFPRFLSEGRLCIFRAFKNRRFAVPQTGQRSVTPWAQDCAKIAGKTEKNNFLLPESSLVGNFRYAASSPIESVVDPHIRVIFNLAYYITLSYLLSTRNL